MKVACRNEWKHGDSGKNAKRSSEVKSEGIYFG